MPLARARLQLQIEPRQLQGFEVLQAAVGQLSQGPVPTPSRILAQQVNAANTLAMRCQIPQ